MKYSSKRIMRSRKTVPIQLWSVATCNTIWNGMILISLVFSFLESNWSASHNLTILNDILFMFDMRFPISCVRLVQSLMWYSFNQMCIFEICECAANVANIRTFTIRNILCAQILNVRNEFSKKKKYFRIFRTIGLIPSVFYSFRWSTSLEAQKSPKYQL